MFANTTANWINAEKICQGAHQLSHLVGIETEDEEDFISNIGTTIQVGRPRSIDLNLNNCFRIVNIMKVYIERNNVQIEYRIP